MSARTLVRTAVALFFAFSMQLGSAAAKPRRSEEFKKLDQEVVRLFQAGKYAEVAERAKRAVTIAEHQFGANDARVAGALSRLAEIYLMQGYYADAEPLCARDRL